MDPSEINQDFKKLCDETSDLIKTGQFKKVVKHFRDNLSDNDPNLIASLRMIASAMKSTEDYKGSNNLHREVYERMKKMGGEDKPEVLESLLDLISSTRNITEAYKLCIHGLEVSNKIQNTDLIEKFKCVKQEVYDHMSDTHKKLYDKLEKSKEVKKTETEIVKKETTSEPVDIDKLIAEFDLEEYDKNDKKKRKNKK